jgi:hypothetical protein
MIKLTFYVGLNDRTTKQQIIDTDAAVNTVYDVFDAATVTKCKGLYKHTDGTRIMENTIRIEVLDFDNNIDATTKARQLAQMFNQESIAVERYNVDSQLIYNN